jgi:polyadenylate-binding protein
VARAQNKEERKQYLKRLHEEKRNEIITKTNVTFTYIVSCFFICLFYIINHMGTLHLFIYTFLFYNRDQISITGIKYLRACFEEFGSITSAKVMRDDKGISRGFGFVCYNTPEEAKSVVSSMRGNPMLFIIIIKK